MCNTEKDPKNVVWEKSLLLVGKLRYNGEIIIYKIIYI